jgi:hypothetical protein
MNVPLATFQMNMETIGNTSAASIPVALDAAVLSGKIKDDDLMVMVGFGAGLTYGGILMKWRGKAGKPKAAAPSVQDSCKTETGKPKRSVIHSV